MYLSDSNECEVLLRLINDCDGLVEQKLIDGNSAFRMISEAAKHHSDHPGERAKRLAEREAKKPEVDQPAEPVPVPVPEF